MYPFFSRKLDQHDTSKKLCISLFYIFDNRVRKKYQKILRRNLILIFNKYYNVDGDEIKIFFLCYLGVFITILDFEVLIGIILNFKT